MERRGFLKGVFGGVAATGLIVAASAQDIEAFAGGMRNGDPLLVPSPHSLPYEMPMIGEVLFNHRGVPIAVVADLSVDIEAIENTPVGAWHTQYTPGRRHIEIRAVSYGPIGSRCIDARGGVISS